MREINEEMLQELMRECKDDFKAYQFFSTKDLDEREGN
jgi:hypothetical protein